jgi:hypothetical protein
MVYGEWIFHPKPSIVHPSSTINHTPMKGFSGKVYTLYALLWFAFFTLLAFPLVIIFSLFGKQRGGNLIWTMAKVWADIWYFLLGIRHKNIFESAYDPARN